MSILMRIIHLARIWSCEGDCLLAVRVSSGQWVIWGSSEESPSIRVQRAYRGNAARLRAAQVKSRILQLFGHPYDRNMIYDGWHEEPDLDLWHMDKRELKHE